MARIGINRYFCEWCSTTFEEKVREYKSRDSKSKGKKNVTAACFCPICNRKVSQKQNV